MIIRENCSLADRNTFGMNVKADCLADWSSVEELRSILTDIKEPVLVMGNAMYGNLQGVRTSYYLADESGQKY